MFLVRFHQRIFPSAHITNNTLNSFSFLIKNEREIISFGPLSELIWCIVLPCRELKICASATELCYRSVLGGTGQSLLIYVAVK